MTKEYIEGSPYSAQFVAVPHSEGEDASFAYGIVRPPFGRANSLLEAVVPGTVEVEDYVTTESTTVLRFTVSTNEGRLDDPAWTHEKRIALARQGLTNIINRLNEIESGEFPTKKSEGA